MNDTPRSAMVLITIWGVLTIGMLACHLGLNAVDAFALYTQTQPRSSTSTQPPQLSNRRIFTQSVEWHSTSLNSVQNKLDGLRTKLVNFQKPKQTTCEINDTSPTPDNRIPFIIQKIGRGDNEDIEEVTRLCIDVFFNEQDGVNDPKLKKVAPWKAMQLAYLRSFQYGDIISRNAFKKNLLVDVIVARRVYADSDAAITNVKEKDRTVIEDLSQINNFDRLSAGPKGSGTINYIAGEIIGYCEVMEKNFGLGANFESNNNSKGEKSKGEKPRPYLSNLSVVEYARKSGIGSKLLDACEDAVREWDAGHTEIVLQVEEDNQSAVQFYKRRGWEFLFADPTCRRYDTSGFFLRESRITKYAMIKRLNTQVPKAEQKADSSGDFGFFFARRIRDTFSTR